MKSETLGGLARGTIWALSPTLYRRVMRTHRGQVFSIGIFTGDSPMTLHGDGIANPVLESTDVTDVPAAFVADPFMVRVNNGWQMLFEVFNRINRRGCIASASSQDGRHWRYNRVVLKEPFHLAYPYVFWWRGRWFMIPDSAGHGVRLYEADDFPQGWRFVATLVANPALCDTSIFEFEGRSWMYSTALDQDSEPESLRLYYADAPLGPWREHPASPVVSGNKRIVRLAGRVQVLGGRPYRFAQDGVPSYGSRINAFEVLELTTRTYREMPACDRPVLSGGRERWNESGMHHVDAHQLGDRVWLACVDGWYASGEPLRRPSTASLAN